MRADFESNIPDSESWASGTPRRIKGQFGRDRVDDSMLVGCAKVVHGPPK